MRDARADTARVVILAGPSGAGKSRLAQRLHAAYGWPVVHLDDFYRDGDDPQLPVAQLGGAPIPDWDDPRSWNADAALAALIRLLDTGSAPVPIYDIGRSRATGQATVTAAPADLVVAEGIFAAELAPALRRSERLAAAYCITQGRWVTFARRLIRDLAERRKPPIVLLRRGWALARREPAVVARATDLGAVCRRPRAAEREIGDGLHPIGG